jgi:uncharacterized protein (DUF4415 family)
MFGGYVGQERDKKKIKELREQVKQDPDNKELQEELKDQEKDYKARINRALRSYMSI